MLFAIQVRTTQAQEQDPVQDIIESLAENLPEDYDMYELRDRFSHFQKQPLDLNNAKPEQLKELVFLSPLQINSLLDHISKNGKLIDILELQGITGFDLLTIGRLLPFVRISSPSVFREFTTAELLDKGKHDLILRYGRLLQTQKGFKSLPGSRYLGTPDKLLMRYRYAYKDNISAALVVEKDAGEYFFRAKTGIDHVSGNINLRNSGIVKSLVLGDYGLQFGQGLTLWSGFGFGKGADVTSVAAKDAGLRPYSSSNESSFFRGIALTLKVQKHVHVELTSFFSYRKLDASLKEAGDGNFSLQNIGVSGLHRTATELKNQKSLSQLLYGAIANYSNKQLTLGILAYQSQYQHQFVTGSQKYNQHSFTGRRLLNTGLNYSYTWGNAYFFGEAAHSIGSGKAFVNGIMASLSGSLSAVVLYRDYGKDYHSFYSNGVGEGSETSNEKGWYAGLNYIPEKRWTFSLYGDYFYFPWLRYRIDAPSSGYEALGQILYCPNKKSKFLLRYKREQKAQNPDAGSTSKGLQIVLKENYRTEANWPINAKFSLQQRFEITHYQKDINKEWGYLIYSDFNYKPLGSQISGNLRLAYFHTPSYNSRLYAYEDDVLYASGFGIYNGYGIRSFVNLRYKPKGPV